MAARPNFYLHTVINRQLRGVTLLGHTALPATPIGARGNRVSYGYRHTINVRVGKQGMFEIRWHSEREDSDTLPRWYLASKVWAYRQQMNDIERMAA